MSNILYLPKIHLILCPNEDNFHPGRHFHTSYVIATDCYGDWVMWDDPTDDWAMKYIAHNPRVGVDVHFRICGSCRKKGIKWSSSAKFVKQSYLLPRFGEDLSD